jgi:hypothetical protein
MDEDEAAQREAEHKAAALYNVGWQTGAGATIWARAAQDVLAQHESARERFDTSTADLETWERLHATALTLVVAIDQVLAFEHRVQQLTGDAELVKARASFNAAFQDAKLLRDLVTHLDDYAVGEGLRQLGKRQPPLDEPHRSYVSTFVYWVCGGGSILDLGDHRLDVSAAARAVIDLAQVVERVRAKHLVRVEQEANAAMQRRYGLPPE